MTTTEQPTKTYGEIYVTICKNGKPRFSVYSLGQFRLFPISRAVAEDSFAAGATVYLKKAGQHIFSEGGVEVFVG